MLADHFRRRPGGGSGRSWGVPSYASGLASVPIQDSLVRTRMPPNTEIPRVQG